MTDTDAMETPITLDVLVPYGQIAIAEIVWVGTQDNLDRFRVTISHEPKRDTTFDDHPLEI